MRPLKLPITKILLLLVLTALLIPLCSIGAAAAGDTATGSVTINFQSSSSSSSGSSSGSGSGSSSGSRSGGTSIRDGDIPRTTATGDAGNTVTILDPEIPLTTLGTLPKTGGHMAITLLFIAAGAGSLLAARLGEMDRLGRQTAHS